MADRYGPPPLTDIAPPGELPRRSSHGQHSAGRSSHHPLAFPFAAGAATGAVLAVILGIPESQMTQPVRDALERLIAEVIRLQEDITQHTARESYLDDQAHRCEVTGLLNRRGLAGGLAHVAAHMNRGGSGGTLVLYHVDGLEGLRRAHGLAAADAVHRHIAGVLAAGLRQSDLAAALGGSDFAVFLALSHGEEAEVKAGALADRLNSPAFLWQDQPYPFTITFGLADLQPDSTLDPLLAQADADLRPIKP